MMEWTLSENMAALPLKEAAMNFVAAMAALAPIAAYMATRDETCTCGRMQEARPRPNAIFSCDYLAPFSQRSSGTLRRNGPMLAYMTTGSPWRGSR